MLAAPGMKDLQPIRLRLTRHGYTRAGARAEILESAATGEPLPTCSTLLP